MSIKEFIMLISSEKLHASTEEDVFDIILAWIHHAKRKRQNYFAEFFRHVRLLHISRDFLSNDVVTNDERLDLVISLGGKHMSYFIGGIEWCRRECEFLNGVDRYDLNTDQWEKLPGL